MKFKALRLLSLVIFISTLLLAACSGSVQTNATGQGDLKMAPMNDMPEEVKAAPVTVQQAYQFAAANPQIMTQLPCYCGCGDMGHTSNYACYVSGVSAEGKVTYDSHALGCSICVDITQDAIRLLKQGKSVAEIRQYVDDTYSKFGPSNIP
jgi:hypothetical protein